MLDYTESVFQQLYYQPGRTYSREFWGNWNLFERYSNKFVNSGMSNNVDVLIVGPAFGFSMEKMKELGFQRIWGIEASDWVHGNMAEQQPDEEIVARIVQGTVGADSHETLSGLLQAAGAPAQFDIVITEDVVGSLGDHEVPAFLDSCEAFLKSGNLARIIHIFTPIMPSRSQNQIINWKTKGDWQAFRPSHTWVPISELTD